MAKSSADNASHLGVKDVVKYAFLPRILPRVSGLVGSGFGYFAYFMALVYAAVRLLPQGHPYLNASNIGRYGVRHVIAAAANSLVISRNNIDQILIFIALLVAIILLALQFVAVLLGLFAPDAMAQNMSPFTFRTVNNQTDIAFILLDRVFGVPGLFNSCVAMGSCVNSEGEAVFTPSSFPWPFHHAMHNLFQFYSVALLGVGVFILLYFIMVIAAETAQTGTPFGKRFNSAWAPIRLVVAIGLLVPIGHGLNASQYLVLYAAKYGSGLATNGWINFNAVLSRGYMTGNEMVGQPIPGQTEELVGFLALAQACSIMEDLYLRPMGDTADVNQIRQRSSSQYGCATKADTAANSPKKIHAYVVTDPFKPQNHMCLTPTTEINEVMKMTKGTEVMIRFGDRNKSLYATERGNVSPLCGDLVLPIEDLKHAGSRHIKQAYLRIIAEIWEMPELEQLALYYINAKFATLANADGEARAEAAQFGSQLSKIRQADFDPTDVLANIRQKVDTAMREKVAEAAAIERCEMRSPVPPLNGQQEEECSSRFLMSEDLIKRGWGGAGIWYNRIAELNGSLVASAQNVANIHLMPYVLENAIASSSEGSGNAQMFDSLRASPERMKRRSALDLPAANVLQSMRDKVLKDSVTGMEPTGNVVFDIINAIFGTGALFELRSEANQQLHPLAQLAGVGRSLMDATIRNLAIGLGTGIGAMFAMPDGLGAISGFAFSIATMTLTAGFILYYIIPFLPFLYFFFAVGTWVKGLFEAMVGMPLWALAHLRIDGNGLPGDAASQGYFMLLEIFLRPLMIIFGLIAAVSIFAASAHVLNEIFDDVLLHVAGKQAATSGDADLMEKVRGPVDTLFYTVLYAIIMYMLAMSSFKLIDNIPKNILRWMGSSTSVFSDFDADPAQNLTQYAAIGGSMMISQSVGGLKGAFAGMQRSAAEARAADK